MNKIIFSEKTEEETKRENEKNEYCYSLFDLVTYVEIDIKELMVFVY